MYRKSVGRSSLERLRRGEGGSVEFPLLPAGFVKILRIEPGVESRFDGGPVAVDHGKPGRVAVAALDDHVLAEDAFEGEAEAPGRCARWRIAGVAFPFEATVAQRIEDVFRHQ